MSLDLPRRGVTPSRLRRALHITLTISLLALGTALIGTATAAPLACGTTITQSATLTEDMECPNGPGLVVQGNGIILNLNGHTISAGPLQTQHVGPYDPPGTVDGPDTEYDVVFTKNDDVGILVMGSGNTVKGPGTVKHFGAGLMVINGDGNTIDGISAIDNIGTPTAGFFGDGIILNKANSNVIKNSTIQGNGWYSGISILGDSRFNDIHTNVIKDNYRPEICGATDETIVGDPDGSGPQPFGTYLFCGPNGDPNTTDDDLPVWAAGPGETRPAYSVIFQQSMGIRFEGDDDNGNGARDNTFRNNNVTGSGNHGVFFGAFCNEDGDGNPFVCTAPGGEGNVRNTVKGNKINANGFGSPYGPSSRMFGGLSGGGSGILWFIPSCGTPAGSNNCPGNPAEHPPGQEKIEGNEVNGNARFGISVNFSQGNTITRNKASGNNAAPVAGGAATFNGHDTNGIAPTDGLDSPCDNNKYQYNSWGSIIGGSPNLSVNQPCLGAKPPKGGQLDHGSEPGASIASFARGRQGPPEQ